MTHCASGSRALLAAVCLILAAAPAGAQQGGSEKTVTIAVGFGVGGVYHNIGLMLSRHLGRHLPGKPPVIVKTMPGAGSLVAANYIANAAPKDGSVMAIIGGGTILEPMFGNDKAKFDPRALGWLGSTTTETNLCAVWHTVPVNRIEDVKTREIVAGSTGRGSRTLTYPTAMNQMLGTKFKVVTGYPGGGQVSQALEQGEVQSYCGWAWGSMKSRSGHWIRDKKLKFLMQFGLQKAPDLPDVPLILDVIPNESDRAAMRLLLIDTYVAWPLVAPAGMAKDKLDGLRAAYMATLDDPQVRAEAEKLKLEIAPVKGEDIQKAVEQAFAAPKDVIERAKALSGL